MRNLKSKPVKYLLFITLFFLLPILGCSTSKQNTGEDNLGNSELRLLALGDSYTIGESVDPQLRWPEQLVKKLREKDYNFYDPLIIAKTGWTTDELIEGIKKINPEKHFDIVTLLIGVNNQYRGKSEINYKEEFVILLNEAVKFADNKKENVFVISIPDYGVTPFADQKNPQKISKEIAEFNSINKQEAENAGVNYINITPISKDAANDNTLLAGDGLHPSEKMYGLWVDKMLPEIISSLNNK